MVQTVEDNAEGLTNLRVTSARRDRRAHGMVSLPSPQDFKQMVISNMILNCPLAISEIWNAHTIFGSNVGSTRGGILQKKP